MVDITIRGLSLVLILERQRDMNMDNKCVMMMILVLRFQLQCPGGCDSGPVVNIYYFYEELSPLIDYTHGQMRGYIKERSTTCDAIICDVSHHVENHTCVPRDQIFIMLEEMMQVDPIRLGHYIYCDENEYVKYDSTTEHQLVKLVHRELIVNTVESD